MHTHDTIDCVTRDALPFFKLAPHAPAPPFATGVPEVEGSTIMPAYVLIVYETGPIKVDVERSGWNNV